VPLTVTSWKSDGRCWAGGLPTHSRHLLSASLVRTIRTSWVRQSSLNGIAPGSTVIPSNAADPTPVQQCSGISTPMR
jgi:hypothetical protein